MDLLQKPNNLSIPLADLGEQAAGVSYMNYLNSLSSSQLDDELNEKLQIFGEAFPSFSNKEKVIALAVMEEFFSFYIEKKVEEEVVAVFSSAV
jgi:hypothetical protein